jgi:hypothetical protein
VKRVLLVALALATAFALVALFAQRKSTALAAEPPAAVPACPELEAHAAQLSYVELAASPHRTEQPGATQVYGWLVREDDGQPVEGGLIRLRYFDYSGSVESARAAHQQATAGGPRASTYRDIRVQEDGGWYADLPGKCWLASVEFTPVTDARELTNRMAIAELGNQSVGALVFSGPVGESGRSTLIHSAVALEVPLERGAVEISFRASSGIEASGLVFDSKTAEPLPGAHVILRSLRGGQLEAVSDARGAFRLRGIDPQELLPENGMLRFLVAASGYQHVEREVAWEAGQTGLPAFKVVLEPRGR